MKGSKQNLFIASVFVAAASAHAMSPIAPDVTCKGKNGADLAALGLTAVGLLPSGHYDAQDALVKKTWQGFYKEGSGSFGRNRKMRC
ncbi:MAG: hypothetical protein ABIR96_09490 [Bdellovibrionota bacterium]